MIECIEVRVVGLELFPDLDFVFSRCGLILIIGFFQSNNLTLCRHDNWLSHRRDRSFCRQIELFANANSLFFVCYTLWLFVSNIVSQVKANSSE